MKKKTKKKVRKQEDEFDFFEIDRTRLDEEWNKQPRLFFNQSVKSSEAKQNLERAKAALDVASAELAQKIRKRPKAYGIKSEKITEAALKEVLTIEVPKLPEWEELLTAKHEADIYSAAVAALDHRKRALQDTVQLELAQWYSDPKVKGATRDDARNIKDRMTFNRAKKGK